MQVVFWPGIMRNQRNFVNLCALVLILASGACNKSENIPTVSLTITSLSPQHGAAGTMVTVKGSGFKSYGVLDSVFINGKKLVFSALTDTSFTVIIPSLLGSGGIEIQFGKERFNGPVFTYDTTVFITTIAGSKSPGYKDGKGTDAQFWGPLALAVDKSGNIYVADDYHFCIRKITLDGTVSTFAGSPTERGYVDGPLLSARFSQIHYLSADEDGNLYMSEGGPHIRKISSTGIVSTIFSSKTIASIDGPSGVGSYQQPIGIAIDLQGNLLLADPVAHKVRKLSKDGYLSRLAGTDNYGELNGPALSATFFSPRAIADDKRGNTYILDMDGFTIRRLNNGVVSTLAGKTTPGFKNGNGIEAIFDYPMDVKCDKDGNIYVADANNNCIRKITPEGIVGVYAGWGTGDADGPPLTGSFAAPFAIDFDQSGNLYVADYYNNKIRKVEMR
jgi:hypothetical protein